MISAFKTISLLIHPFIPHLSEEIWSKLSGDQLAIQQSWPKQTSNIGERSVKIAIQINGKTKDIIEYKKDPGKDLILDSLKNNEKIQKIITEKEIKKVIHVPNKIINLVI